jgi:hypothetical protein
MKFSKGDVQKEVFERRSSTGELQKRIFKRISSKNIFKRISSKEYYQYTVNNYRLVTGMTTGENLHLQALPRNYIGKCFRF